MWGTLQKQIREITDDDLYPGVEVRLWRHYELPDTIRESKLFIDHYTSIDQVTVEAQYLGKYCTIEGIFGYTADGSTLWNVTGIPDLIVSHYWVAEILTPRCECGAHTVGSHLHSDWCPSYNRLQIYRKEFRT